MTHADIQFILQLLAAASTVVTPAALWWLSRHFVMRSEYENLCPKVDRIEQTLIRMESQQEQLDDHEERIRSIEHSLR
jgi:hypothetical protein